MQLSNLAVCYEGIQRIYRNAVVDMCRSALTAAFPVSYEAELRKPFSAEEWRGIEENCHRSRVSGQVSSAVRDDFDLLGVNHFFNLFERNYDLFFPIPKNADKVERRSDKKRVLEWARTVKELRDPASHPTEEDFSYEDAFMFLDCARRVLVQLKLHESAQILKNLAASLSGHGHVIGEPLEAALPASESIVCDFVGRERELRTLWEWVANPTSRRWALSGAGGKGKTAIAYKFALEVRDGAPDPLQAVLWLSAKKRRFAEGKIVSVPTPDFSNLDAALNQILFQYGWIEEIGKSIEAKRSRAIELFNEFPSLIIADDIDSIETSEEDVIEFFSFTLPQTRSKVLVTSRRVIWGMANTTTHVEGFSESDVGRFITSRCHMFELDRSLFDSRKVQEMLRITEGSPLYLEDLLRLMSVVPPQDAIVSWADKKGHAARQYALGRELELLSRDARHVLLAACFYPNAVSFEELKAITGHDGNSLTDSLSQLQGLFLVPRPKLIEGEARFEINVNVRALVQETEGKSELYRAVEAAYKSVSGALPRVGRGDIGALIRQAVLLVKNGEEQHAETLLQRALDLHPNDPDLIGVLGFVYRRMQPPRYTDARSCFARSHQLNNKTDEMHKHWARMEMDLREWTKAAEAAEKGLQKRPNSKQLAYLAGVARGRLGQEMLSRAQRVSAEEEHRKALTHLSYAFAQPSITQDDANIEPGIYRGIALSCFALGDRSGVCSVFSRWLKEHPDDINASSEWERISLRMGLSADDLEHNPIAPITVAAAK